MSTDDLLAAALRLPRCERARLTEEMLASFKEPAEQVAVAWAEELERRSRDIGKGLVEAQDWETVRDKIMRDLDLRRANRRREAPVLSAATH
ncbi:MAG: addiction module protein [Acidobacteria bacterium]|nr:addiction module protein [Acidobacteriota bacterium]